MKLFKNERSKVTAAATEEEVEITVHCGMKKGTTNAIKEKREREKKVVRDLSVVAAQQQQQQLTP